MNYITINDLPFLASGRQEMILMKRKPSWDSQFGLFIDILPCSCGSCCKLVKYIYLLGSNSWISLSSFPYLLLDPFPVLSVVNRRNRFSNEWRERNFSLQKYGQLSFVPGAGPILSSDPWGRKYVLSALIILDETAFQRFYRENWNRSEFCSQSKGSLVSKLRVLRFAINFIPYRLAKLSLSFVQHQPHSPSHRSLHSSPTY